MPGMGGKPLRTVLLYCINAFVCVHVVAGVIKHLQFPAVPSDKASMDKLGMVALRIDLCFQVGMRPSGRSSNMIRSFAKTIIVAAIIIAAGGSQSFADAVPTGSSYMLYDEWGGMWADAEKTYSNTEDDNMCWAAAASNALEWTGWGKVTGLVTTDDMFAYFQDHWTDAGGLMEFGWGWWFDGTNASQGWSGWSQVDVSGGGFYPESSFSNYYSRQWYDPYAMSSIDEFMRAGSSVTLGVYGPGGHAITCWGFNYNPDDPTDYYGIWVTDSDDSKYSSDPQDRLRYYEVEYDTLENAWYLQNFYGSNAWYVSEVQALGLTPFSPVLGDTDSDRDVDDADLNMLLANFGTESGASRAEGDFDGDGDVDDADLNLLLTNFGSVAAVPEPAVMTVLIGGGIILLTRKRP